MKFKHKWNHDSKYIICKCGHDRTKHPYYNPEFSSACNVDDCECKKFEEKK